MAGEFKYNEKTGMYEIVKDNKENNTTKEIGAIRDVQDPINTLNQNQQTSIQHNEAQQTSEQLNQSEYTERKVENNEPRKTTNYTEQQMNTHRTNKVEKTNHTKTEQTSSNSQNQQSYNRNNSRLDSEHQQHKQRQSYNNQSHRPNNNNNNFNRPRNSFEELLENEQTMGMLVWVGTLIGMFVFNVSLVFIAIPIIFYVLYEKKSQFVRNHAREAVNVCISSLIYSLVIVIGSFVMNAILFLIPPLAFMSMLFTVFGIIGVLAYTLIVGIQGAMAANKNEPYTPPFTFRFLKK